MARGIRRTKKDILENKLEKITESIEKTETTLKELKAEANALRNEIQDTELKELKEMLDKEGLDVADLRELLSSPKEK